MMSNIIIAKILTHFYRPIKGGKSRNIISYSFRGSMVYKITHDFTVHIYATNINFCAVNNCSIINRYFVTLLNLFLQDYKFFILPKVDQSQYKDELAIKVLNVGIRIFSIILGLKSVNRFMNEDNMISIELCTLE